MTETSDIKQKSQDADPIEDLDVSKEDADAIRAGLLVQPAEMPVTKPVDNSSTTILR